MYRKASIDTKNELLVKSVSISYIGMGISLP